jgi:hypothetical protein
VPILAIEAVVMRLKAYAMPLREPDALTEKISKIKSRRYSRFPLRTYTIEGAAIRAANLKYGIVNPVKVGKKTIGWRGSYKSSAFS